MTDRDPQSVLANLSPEQRAAVFERLQIERRRVASGTASPPVSAIRRQPRTTARFPLSFAQHRMWLLDQLEGPSSLYSVPEAFLLRGRLRSDALRVALQHIVARHEILRTSFVEDDTGSWQVIGDPPRIEFGTIDLTGFPADERASVARRIASVELARPFVLTAPPLFRTMLLRLAPDEHVLLLLMHHIIYDGWSASVLLRELSALYEQEVTGAPARLPALAVQYVDFAVWQRELLDGPTGERALAYWKQQLAGVPPLQLPLDHPRPAMQTHRGAAISTVLPPQLASALEALSRAEGCTLFMTLLAAFEVLLCHHTGQHDLAVGTLTANRTRPEIEGLLGDFVSTLVMRGKLAGNPTVRELLRATRATALDAYAHQDLPFERLLDYLQTDRDPSRAPLFQALFVLQNTPSPTAQTGAQAALQMSRWELHTDQVKVDLSLEVELQASRVVAELAYNRDLFDSPTIERMLGHFEQLLAAFVAEPDRRVLELPLLSAIERAELARWNATAADYPAACVHELIADQADRTPDAIAAERGDHQLTYAELDACANQLAHHLRSLGVGRGALVGLCLERSLDMLIAAIAIHKAGAAYLPLDPEYPVAQLAFIIADSRVALIVGDSRAEAKLAGARVVCLDRARDAIAAQPRTRPAVAISPADCAYAIYTSGSTGKPKGVQVPHRAVVNLLSAMRKQPGIQPSDRLLAITTLAFDIAGLELFLPLLVGACVIIVPRDEVTAGELLLARLRSSGATMMQATPSTWRMLIDAGWDASPGLTVLCGGEALSRELASQLIARAAAVWNVYGPTEATIWATVSRVAGDGPVTLGLPVGNLAAHVLNAALEPAPVGVAGELYLAGDGVAWGYLARPGLTAERFVPEPGAAGRRMYRTGDLVRRLASGELEFLGRVDHQVKIRGHRIELGEIERTLDEHPGVAACVAVAREDRPGAKRLVAYYIPRDTGLAAGALTSFLQQRLPDYMVPSAIVALAAFPLTANGKIDRRALPAPAFAASDYVAPATPVEQALAQIWGEVLGVEQVSATASFFELGGDSLLVIRMVARANKLGLGLTSKRVFTHRVLRELAAVAGQGATLAEQGEITGPVPFTPIHRWWLEFDLPTPAYYNIAFVLECLAPLDTAALTETLAELVRYHDALRLRLVDGPAGAQLVSDAFTGIAVERRNLSAVADSELAAAIADAAREVQLAFDLAAGPAFRAAIIDCGRGRPERLLLAAHYIAADLESWQILLGDIDAMYAQRRRDEPIQLPAKGASYRQWANRLASYASSDELRAEADYWLHPSRSRIAPLPRDGRGGPNTLGSCDVVVELLTVAETEALQNDVLKPAELSLDGAILCAMVDALEPWTGRRAQPFSLVGHGRPPLFDDVDLSRTVGWLNVVYPAFVDLTDVTDLRAAVALANQQVRAIPRWGVGYGVLRYLGDEAIREQFRRMPSQTEIMFNYMGPRAWEYAQFKLGGAYGGYVHDERGERPHLLSITSGLIGDGQLELRWEYSENMHRRETIEALARRTSGRLRALIAR